MDLNADITFTMMGGKSAKTAGILKNLPHRRAQGKIHSGKIWNPVVQIPEVSKVHNFS